MFIEVEVKLSDLHIHLHTDGDERANRRLFEQILAHVRETQMNVKDIQTSIDNLGTRISDLETVEESSITLLGGLSATIADLKKQLEDAVAANDPSAVQAALDALGALGTKVDTDKQKLADAVTANTPTA